MNSTSSIEPCINNVHLLNCGHLKHSKMLHILLLLAKNARVMITKNICVSDGLANGVTGRIVDFIEDNKKVSHILIKCDNPKAGRVHRATCKHCHGHDTICVT